MRRRSFLKALFAPLIVTLPRPQQAPAKQQTAPIYSDSSGRTSAELASLHDGNTQSGGIEYQA